MPGTCNCFLKGLTSRAWKFPKWSTYQRLSTCQWMKACPRVGGPKPVHFSGPSAVHLSVIQRLSSCQWNSCPHCPHISTVTILPDWGLDLFSFRAETGTLFSSSPKLVLFWGVFFFQNKLSDLFWVIYKCVTLPVTDMTCKAPFLMYTYYFLKIIQVK